MGQASPVEQAQPGKLPNTNKSIVQHDAMIQVARLLLSRGRFGQERNHRSLLEMTIRAATPVLLPA